MKHAYLIIAHNEFDVLQQLVALIDDERNDIFIHFDAKVKELPIITATKSQLYVLKNRYNVAWGDFSIVQVEVALLKEAVSINQYDYYHIISGVDMPLKNQDYIHNFFNEHRGKEFIGYYPDNISDEISRRVQKWHLFPRYFSKYASDYPIRRLLRGLFLRFQYLVGYKRNKNICFKKGTQWVSITDALARLIVEQELEIKRVYTHTFCSDEIFIQTICWNSPYKDNIYNINDEGASCLRAIKWVDGELLDWKEQEIYDLLQSKCIFARKFSKNQQNLIDRVKDGICINY